MVPSSNSKVKRNRPGSRKPADCYLFRAQVGETAQEEITMPADILGFGYALTVAAGGIIGYLKAGNFLLNC